MGVGAGPAPHRMQGEALNLTWFRGAERKDGWMKVCPECRTKNDDLSHFCKKCGFLLANSSLKEKRDKVLAQKRLPWMWITLIIAGFALG